jgi:TetR/AcrR family fatty acid metabolism transcriptional regulator
VDETERRNTIAEAAVSVFAANGYSESTVQQIADEANISKGSIYQYYESKAEILYEIFQTFETALHDTFDRQLETDKSPTEKLGHLLKELTELVELNRPTIAVLFDFWSTSLHSDAEPKIDFESFYTRLQNKLALLLDTQVPDGQIRSDLDESVTSILIGFFEGQLVQWLVNPSGPSINQVRETGYDLIMNGILEHSKQ